MVRVERLFIKISADNLSEKRGGITDKLKDFISRHRYDIIRAAAALAASLAVMLLLPAMIMGVSPDMGMMVCIALFFFIDPIFSLAAGIYAGRDIKNRWYISAFPPAAFLFGSSVAFGASALEFTIYAIIYAAISIPVMFFTYLVKKHAE